MGEEPFHARSFGERVRPEHSLALPVYKDFHIDAIQCIIGECAQGGRTLKMNALENRLIGPFSHAKSLECAHFNYHDR